MSEAPLSWDPSHVSNSSFILQRRIVQYRGNTIILLWLFLKYKVFFVKEQFILFRYINFIYGSTIRIRISKRFSIWPDPMPAEEVFLVVCFQIRYFVVSWILIFLQNNLPTPADAWGLGSVKQTGKWHSLDFFLLCKAVLKFFRN